MTFSTQSVVEAIQHDWVPVWERVADVRTATFDLGNGESVTGTISGEIALFFCRPDGVVFDVLPGLQSPAATLAAIDDALDFYATTGATRDAIAARHAAALARPGALSPEAARAARDRAHARRELGRAEPDTATRDLAEMSLSKVLMVTPAETITVVEPGGVEIFTTLVHEMLLDGEAREPLGWRHELFAEILQQPLEGGEVTYDARSIGALSLDD